MWLRGAKRRSNVAGVSHGVTLANLRSGSEAGPGYSISLDSGPVFQRGKLKIAGMTGGGLPNIVQNDLEGPIKLFLPGSPSAKPLLVAVLSQIEGGRTERRR